MKYIRNYKSQQIKTFHHKCGQGIDELVNDFLDKMNQLRYKYDIDKNQYVWDLINIKFYCNNYNKYATCIIYANFNIEDLDKIIENAVFEVRTNTNSNTGDHYFPVMIKSNISHNE